MNKVLVAGEARPGTNHRDLSGRRRKQLQMRVKAAEVRSVKLLADFDFVLGNHNSGLDSRKQS